MDTHYSFILQCFTHRFSFFFFFLHADQINSHIATVSVSHRKTTFITESGSGKQLPASLSVSERKWVRHTLQYDQSLFVAAAQRVDTPLTLFLGKLYNHVCRFLNVRWPSLDKIHTFQNRASKMPDPPQGCHLKSPLRSHSIICPLLAPERLIFSNMLQQLEYFNTNELAERLFRMSASSVIHNRGKQFVAPAAGKTKTTPD